MKNNNPSKNIDSRNEVSKDESESLVTPEINLLEKKESNLILMRK